MENILGDISFETPPLPSGTCEECCGYGWTLHTFWTDQNIEYDGEVFDDWVDCIECNGVGDKHGNDE